MADYNGFIPSYSNITKDFTLLINSVVSSLNVITLSVNTNDSTKIVQTEQKLGSLPSYPITLSNLNVSSLSVSFNSFIPDLKVLKTQFPTNPTPTGIDSKVPTYILPSIEGKATWAGIDSKVPIEIKTFIGDSQWIGIDSKVPIEIKTFIGDSQWIGIDSKVPTYILSSIEPVPPDTGIYKQIPIQIISDIYGDAKWAGIDSKVPTYFTTDIYGDAKWAGIDSKVPTYFTTDIYGVSQYTGILSKVPIYVNPYIESSSFLCSQIPSIIGIITNALDINLSIQDKDTISLVFISSVPTPFVITSLPILYINKYDQYIYNITTNSIFSNVIVKLKSLTSWLEVTNNTLMGYANSEGSYTVILEVTDGFNTQTQSFIITVLVQTVPIIEPVWSLLDNENQITLAIIKPYNRVTKRVESLYFGTEGYVTYPSDSPPNVSFIGSIKEIPKFDHKISAAMDASTDASFGRLVLMNFSGELDNLILNYSFGYRSIKIYRGNPNKKFSTFKLVLDGVVGRNSITISATDITLDIYDKRELFNTPVQTDIIKDKIPPVVFGRCYNISGVLIDEVNLVYKLNYTRIHKIIEIRDAGASFTQLKVEGINDFSINLEKAEVTLVSPPYGEITFDVEGTVDSNGYYPETAADILKYLILNHTTLTTDDIDLTSFSYLNSVCPQKLNYYSGEKTSVADIYTSVFSTIGSFCIPRRSDGKFKCMKFDSPKGTPRMDIDESLIKLEGFSPDRLIAPIESLLLGFRENYTPIDRSSQAKFAYISIKNSIELSKSWYNRILLRNNNILTIYADAVIFDENESGDNGLVPTNFTNYNDALAEGLRRLKMYGFQRIVYKLEGFDSLYPLEIGDIVNIQYKRFGFNNGLLVVIIGISESESGITLEVFR